MSDNLLFNDDDIIFAPEDTEEQKQNLKLNENKWIVLIVDDEEDVHSTTKLVLSDFVFEGMGLEFLSAYTGEECLKIMKGRNDIAVVLLDVVMESNQAGLDVADKIRNTLDNSFVRIILRTGQPGEAPERKVIAEYDINDYKNKAELTTQQLYTAMYSSLRSFRDLRIIDKNRQGLNQIINATANLFQRRNLTQLAKGVLTQIMSLFGLGSSYYVSTSGFTASQLDDGNFEILAATGRFEACLNGDIEHCKEIPVDIMPFLKETLKNKKSGFVNGHYIGYFPTLEDKIHLLFVEDCKKCKEEAVEGLLKIFSHNAGIAFDNVVLNEEIKDTQVDLIFRLGEVVESRSKETAYHVQRVSEYTYIIAKAMGLDEDEAELFKLAAPLHDIGKIGIKDSILMKPESLTSEEYEIMKTHTEIGYKILRGSNRPLLKTGASIALEHHERWDGNGYPRGISGESIHVAARIVSLADIFDALGSKRVYKGPWDSKSILEFIHEQKGLIFDPKVVDAFVESFSEIEKIKNKFRDE